MFLGLPPQSAIAAHRLASICGHTQSLPKYIRAKKILWKYAIAIIPIGLVGNIIGANIMLNMDTEILSKGVGIVILLPLPFLFLRKIGLKRHEVSQMKMIIGVLLFFCLAIWVGIFPPGGVTLFIYLAVTLFGWTFTEARASKLPSSCVSSVILIGMFIFAGIVRWSMTIPLMLGYIIGSNIGALTAIRKGDTWVRNLLTVVVVVFSIKLLFF